MKINHKIQLFMGILFASASFVACNKNNPYPTITPPAQATFSNKTDGSYFVMNDPNSVFKIPVGTTNVTNTTRTITVSVTSPTNAAAGVQYNLPSTSVQIGPGKALDSLPVYGLFSGFSGNRVDTLVFKISGGDIPPSDYNNTYKLVMRKYCTVVPNSFLGNYNNSQDIDNTGSYGPYTAQILSITPTSATTATMVIANFSYEEIAPYPINNITVNLDWTDPANFKTTVPTQVISNSNFYGYGALSVAPNGTGTFSSCDNTFTFQYKLTVSAGSFGNFTTVLAR
ncbi:hypothetical protein [Hydrotalea sp.]|uniref:hypothetical protein n=1 Tax=Hydrotalea sp. TaxID=2881279 RepID=UPI003D143FC8